jgi:uncharacterized membrane protein YphA (DoxX/SURF4 family)
MQYAAILWALSAIVIIRAAWRSSRHLDALRTGRLAFAFLFLVAGAGMNALFLTIGETYSKFADGTYLVFVRHTWHSLVVPHPGLWIGLLIAFEATVGLLALAGGKRLQVAYGLAIAFHVGLLAFGWGFFLWALPMITAFATLLHNERRRERTLALRRVGIRLSA